MQLIDEPTATEQAKPPVNYGQAVGLAAGVLALAAVLLTGPPDGLSEAGWRAAGVGLLMAAWWVTEALPIAATALVPLVLFPLLGVADAEASASPYANPVIFLFLGGFLLALGMERWALHRRIALSIVRWIGTRPASIVLGFMLAAAFLSMWVSNTATAMMMLPIGLSVADLARADAEAPDRLAVVLMLGIAYACSIGGMATLVGTPTNALLAGFMLETYGIEVAFVEWLAVGSVLMVVMLPVVFFVLTRIVFPLPSTPIRGGRAYVEQELARLGPMSRAEKIVAATFGCVAVLWIVRPLLPVAGLSDHVIAMAGALLLFAVPAGRGQAVLDWEATVKLPWGVLLLFGGGLSLAAAINDTGLAAWIGSFAGRFDAWPIVAVVAVVTTAIVFLTELTSNTATAAAFLPVMAAVALGMGQHPLVLAVPAVLAASCAFMLPVATPPNAIVYGSGRVSIAQMARAGLLLNLVSIVIITALAWGLLPLVMDLGQLPASAPATAP